MEEDFSNKKPSLHSSGWTSHSESKIAHLKSKKLVNLFIPMSDIRLVNASLKSLIGLDAQKISSSDSEKIINQNTVSVLTEAVGYDWYSKILLDLDDEIDTQEEMPFIICPFNRYSPEKHLFRSPWSSQYYPEENKGDDFRELFGEAYQELSGMERRANELFYNYGEMYHGGRKGLVTSFYIIDYERDQLIECIFLLKKKTESSIWSTSHYFKIIFKDKEKIYFNCISAVYSKTTLSGWEISHKNDSKVEQSVKEGKNDTKLIVAKMGEILEEVEKVRNIFIIYHSNFLMTSKK